VNVLHSRTREQIFSVILPVFSCVLKEALTPADPPSKESYGLRIGLRSRKFGLSPGHYFVNYYYSTEPQMGFYPVAVVLQ
jgi:hypothetical protein